MLPRRPAQCSPGAASPRVGVGRRRDGHQPLKAAQVACVALVEGPLVQQADEFKRDPSCRDAATCLRRFERLDVDPIISKRTSRARPGADRNACRTLARFTQALEDVRSSRALVALATAARPSLPMDFNKVCNRCRVTRAGSPASSRSSVFRTAAKAFSQAAASSWATSAPIAEGLPSLIASRSRCAAARARAAC